MKDFIPMYSPAATKSFKSNRRAIIEAYASINVPESSICKALDALAGALALGQIIHLPDNGEIYRGNDRPANDDEIAALEYIPAPITVLEYLWGGIKRIDIVEDAPHFYDTKSDKLITSSIIFDPVGRFWAPLPVSSTFSFKDPNRRADGRLECKWTALVNELRGQQWLSQVCADNFQESNGALVQVCYSLMAGATIEPVSDKSPTMRRKMRKRGLTGFDYHILQIPGHEHATGEHRGGSHASPRLHFRRAHIRKLPSGRPTFVRSCLVGSPETGTVEKHYSMKSTAIH